MSYKTKRPQYKKTSKACPKPCPKPSRSKCDEVVIIKGEDIVKKPYVFEESGVYHLCGDVYWEGPGKNPFIIRADGVTFDLQSFTIMMKVK
jgi:hypothetical protein